MRLETACRALAAAMPLITFAALPASAVTSVDVVNAGFEAPDTLSFNSSPVADWVISGGPAGVFYPDAYPGFGGSTTNPGAIFKAGVVGDQTAYSNAGDLSQVLAASAAAGKYTLSVAVGDRIDSLLPLHTINLFAGSSIIATATGAGSGTRADEGWSDLVATGDLLIGDALIGQTLSIQLVNSGGTQVNWDNVRLDFAAIPGPASALLLVSAFGLAGLARRSRV